MFQKLNYVLEILKYHIANSITVFKKSFNTTRTSDFYSLSSNKILIDFSLTVKAATSIFIYGRGLAISSAKQGKSGSIYNLVKNK